MDDDQCSEKEAKELKQRSGSLQKQTSAPMLLHQRFYDCGDAKETGRNVDVDG
jgi:hypothetical protein